MKVVYICHPIRSDKINNIVNVIKIVRAINLFLPNIVPLTNYVTDSLALNDDIKEEREKGLLNDEVILKSGIVDELWVFGDEISAGMQLEINTAQKMGIAVRYFTESDIVAEKQNDNKKNKKGV